MARKDDPVFNVKFVQLVESHPCLWNSTLPAYSKKEEILKAWQAVAIETRDTVRNCRERWRTIRSSFLRSLKLSRTTTGRGKRKYYLSKYLQFLIPYTKSRLRNSGGSGAAAGSATGSGATSTTMLALRKTSLHQHQQQQQQQQSQSQTMSQTQSQQSPRSSPPPPMTRINQFALPLVSSDDTKDSTNSEVAIAEEDVLVALQEGAHQQRFPMAIKIEQGATSSSVAATAAVKSPDSIEQKRAALEAAATLTLSTALAQNQQQQQQQQQQQHQQQQLNASNVDLTEFADWIKCKNNNELHHRHCFMTSPSNPNPNSSPSPDADQSFLNSLHPFLKEMSGKQNRRFRQKVVALIDAILDNAD